MRHFHPPIHAVVVAVTLVAGLASYQGVDKLVLAKGGATYGTDGESGHESSPGNGSGEPHQSASTTSTTVHHEPTSSTIPTPPPDPGSTTSTTVHHEPGSTTSTTVHKETPPPSPTTTIFHEPTAPPTTTQPTTPPPTSVPLLSFGCMNGFTGDQGWAKCGWSQSKSPNFDHYVLTRELVGTPRQVIFETGDVTNTYFVDGPLQAGAQYSYMIGAYDAAGSLIGQGGGPIHLTCCPGGIATP